MKIVQLTVGEYPNLRSVSGSQVLANAIGFKKMGHDVLWLAVIPWTSLWVEKITKMNWIAITARECAKAGVEFVVVGTWISMMRPHSFLLRDVELNRLIPKLKRYLPESDAETVLNCRSYYAADMAIRLKQKYPESQLKVSFDMRSTLPEEFPLVMKYVGKLVYGYAKEWEYDLLTQADVAVLPVMNACRSLWLETGVTIEQVPISGFNRELTELNKNFEDKWHKKTIAYVGSVGVWNRDADIWKMFDCFPGWKKCVVSLSRLASPSPEVECLSLDYEQMSDFYSKVLAVVIAVGGGGDSYFWVRKYRTNYFSVKAAEALSMGIPLIVDSSLLELADFVRSHNCGLVYDCIHQSFEGISDEEFIAEDKPLWENLSDNARTISRMFQRESVLEEYVRLWEGL